MEALRARPWTLTAGAFLVLGLAVLAAFSPALEAGFVNWDDEANVVDNRHFRGLGRRELQWMWTTPHGGPYMPLTWMSMAIDYELRGLSEGLEAEEAPGYHATSLLLHALAGMAVYVLALRLFARARPGARAGDRALAALLAALLFAIHPLRVESVAWVTERRDVLSGLFFTLAALTYVRAAPAGRYEIRAGPALGAIGAAALGVVVFFLAVELGDERLRLRGGPWGLAAAAGLLATSVALAPRAGRTRDPGGEAGRSLAFGLACLWLTLAFLSKALGVALPLVLVVLDVWPLRRWRRGDGPGALAALAVEKAPMVALSLVFGVLALWGQARYPEALAQLEFHGASERIAQAFYGLWFYTTRTLVPLGLIPIVELPDEMSLASPRWLLPALAVLLGAAVLWIGRRRAPAAACAFASFALLVAPVLGLTQAGGQLVADRYTYLPCIPLALLAGGAWLVWRERRRTATAPVAALAAVLALGGLTWRQARVWRSSEELWAHTMAVAPESGLPHVMLGMLRYREAQGLDQPGKREKWVAAREQFERGLALDPEPNPYYLSVYGALLIDLGETERGAAVLEDFLRRRPDDHRGLVNLAIALRGSGRTAEALRPLERALEVEPGYTRAWLQLALTHEALGNDELALRAYEQVLERWPSYARAKQRARELRAALGSDTGSRPRRE